MRWDRPWDGLIPLRSLSKSRIGLFLLDCASLIVSFELVLILLWIAQVASPDCDQEQRQH